MCENFKIPFPKRFVIAKNFHCSINTLLSRVLFFLNVLWRLAIQNADQRILYFITIKYNYGSTNRMRNSVLKIDNIKK